MTEITPVEGLDPNIATLLPAAATPGEKLQALSIDDNRRMHSERIAIDVERNQQIDRSLDQYDHQLSNGDVNKDSFARQATAAEALAKVLQEGQAPVVFNEPDQLLHSLVRLCIDVRGRNQPMSTTTARDTVMKDVVDDGVWMGVYAYNKLAALKGLPPIQQPA